MLGLDGFPVFTRKASTDISFLACARRLLAMTDRIYPQFATHNAHTMAAVLHMAGERKDFEFQRLHGMGEVLHEAVREAHRTRCRIYAPVDAHHDLRAYLLRRLLENGANSSFVNQIVDESVTPEEIARDPITVIEGLGGAVANPRIAAPADLFMPERRNSKGWDLNDPLAMATVEAERARFRTATWEAGPLIAGKAEGAELAEVRYPETRKAEVRISEARNPDTRNPDERASGAGSPEHADAIVRDHGHDDRLHAVRNPARPEEIVGHVTRSAPADIEAALEAARFGARAWASASVEDRASRVRRVADLYEANAAELFALAAGEAVRECATRQRTPRGVIACISP